MWYLKYPEKPSRMKPSQLLLGQAGSVPYIHASEGSRKTCWPFLANNEPTWTQPEQVTSPHMVTQTEEVETTQNCIQQPHTWEAQAVENGLRLLLPEFGFLELFVSHGCKTSLATNQSCHLEILSFLSRMFKFKPQTCG